MRYTRHGGDDDAQIGVDGEVVGEVPIVHGEDEHAMDTVRTRATGCDASRRPLDDASDLAAQLVKMRRLVRSRCWRDDRGSLPSIE